MLSRFFRREPEVKAASEIQVVELIGRDVMSCSKCRTHLALKEEIISPSFFGHNGKAYLYETAYNVCYGKTEQRQLLTGTHEVCDVYCVCCGNYLGWKYEKTPSPRESYKLGKFILERKSLWDENEKY